MDHRRAEIKTNVSAQLQSKTLASRRAMKIVAIPVVNGFVWLNPTNSQPLGQSTTGCASAFPHRRSRDVSACLSVYRYCSAFNQKAPRKRLIGRPARSSASWHMVRGFDGRSPTAGNSLALKGCDALGPLCGRIKTCIFLNDFSRRGAIWFGRYPWFCFVIAQNTPFGKVFGWAPIRKSCHWPTLGTRGLVATRR